MQSPNKKAMTTDEREYVRLLKMLPCSVCDCGGGLAAPSEAHEIEQGVWWLSVALCSLCHRGALLGWHGQKRAWTLRKMTMLDALAITIQRVYLKNKAATLSTRAPVAIKTVATH